MAHEREQILERIRRHGGRITEARRTVIDAMIDAPSHHLTAPDVVAAVRQANPEFYESTVYRTLDRLEQMGVVDRIIINSGSVVFHLAHRAHQHLVCDRCGVVVEAPADLLDGVAAAIEASHGFELHAVATTLHGVCATCR